MSDRAGDQRPGFELEHAASCAGLRLAMMHYRRRGQTVYELWDDNRCPNRPMETFDTATELCRRLVVILGEQGIKLAHPD